MTQQDRNMYEFFTNKDFTYFVALFGEHYFWMKGVLDGGRTIETNAIMHPCSASSALHSVWWNFHPWTCVLHVKYFISCVYFNLPVLFVVYQV
jgi:hypothetical protein